MSLGIIKGQEYLLQLILSIFFCGSCGQKGILKKWERKETDICQRYILGDTEEGREKFKNIQNNLLSFRDSVGFLYPIEK